ncbi:MAG: YbaK/EbsC family protein [Rhizobiaceae bacterium]
MLLEYLKVCDFKIKTITHPPLFTVEESKELRGSMEGGHTKNLFLKDKKGKYFLLTAKEDSVVNLKTLHRLLGGSGRVSFGKPEMLLELLGVKPGAVTALGIINDRENRVRFAIDKELLKNEKINCHPLTNEATTTLYCDDLLTFSKACGHAPLIVDLCDDG